MHTTLSPAPPPQNLQYGTLSSPYSPWQPYIRTLRATTLLIHMCITTKALFRGGENTSALFYAPAAPYQPRRLQIDVALRGSLHRQG